MNNVLSWDVIHYIIGDLRSQYHGPDLTEKLIVKMLNKIVFIGDPRISVF